MKPGNLFSGFHFFAGILALGVKKYISMQYACSINRVNCRCGGIMMRKLLSVLLALLVWMPAVPALASLDDTRATIAAQYGD